MFWEEIEGESKNAYPYGVCYIALIAVSITKTKQVPLFTSPTCTSNKYK